MTVTEDMCHHSCPTSMPHICSPSFLSMGGRFVSPSAILQSELEGKGRRKTQNNYIIRCNSECVGQLG